MSLANATDLQSGTRRLLMCLVLFTLLFSMVVYTFLHEAGHILVGLASGQTVTALNINFLKLGAAHAGLAGELTSVQRAAQTAAGVGLPLLVWVAFMLLTPRKTIPPVHLLRLLVSVTVLCTLLAWIILPLMSLFGQPNQADDVGRFLVASQMPPLLLSALAAALFAVGWAFFLGKSGSLADQLAKFGDMNRGDLTAGAATVVPLMAGAMVLCLGTVFISNAVVPDRSAAESGPPAGYRPVVQIDLSAAPFAAQVVAEFSLAQAQEVGVYYVFEDLDTNNLVFWLEGPEGYSLVLVEGKDWQASRTTARRTEPLLPGDYRLMLTADSSTGTLLIHMKDLLPQGESVPTGKYLYQGIAAR